MSTSRIHRSEESASFREHPHRCMWAGIQHFSQKNTPCSLSPLERGSKLFAGKFEWREKSLEILRPILDGRHGIVQGIKLGFCPHVGHNVSIRIRGDTCDRGFAATQYNRLIGE